jgi:hypothetical protein
MPRYGDYFSRDAEVELTEWYLPPQGLFIVLEREGKLSPPARTNRKMPHGGNQTYLDPSSSAPAGLAAKVVQELERRAVLAGYSHIYLTTGFRQPEAVRLYLSQGYEAQFDLSRDPEEYSQPPFDGRLRFTKALAVSAQPKRLRRNMQRKRLKWSRRAIRCGRSARWWRCWCWRW